MYKEKISIIPPLIEYWPGSVTKSTSSNFSFSSNLSIVSSSSFEFNSSFIVFFEVQFYGLLFLK